MKVKPCVSRAVGHFDSLFRGISLESFLLLPIDRVGEVAPDDVVALYKDREETWLVFESHAVRAFIFWVPLPFFLFTESLVIFSSAAVTWLLSSVLVISTASGRVAPEKLSPFDNGLDEDPGSESSFFICFCLPVWSHDYLGK